MPVFKTEVKNKQGKGIEWNQIFIDTDTLCNNIDDQPILFQVFQHARNGSHKKVGQKEVTLGELKQGTTQF